MTNMTPIPIPEQAVRSNPKLRALHVGPPPGMTDQECGTVESLYGVEDGLPVYADYWRPTPEQLEDLANGGYIELRQYVPQMIMHAMTVHAVDQPRCSSCGQPFNTPGCQRSPDELGAFHTIAGHGGRASNGAAE